MKARGINLLFILNRIFPGWEPEYKFDNKRKWRMDYAHVGRKIAIEIEGGIWVKGRHTRGKGFLNDIEKYNKAMILGWRLFRYAPDMINSVIADMEYIRDFEDSKMHGEQK